MTRHGGPARSNRWPDELKPATSEQLQRNGPARHGGAGGACGRTAGMASEAHREVRTASGTIRGRQPPGVHLLLGLDGDPALQLIVHLTLRAVWPSSMSFGRSTSANGSRPGTGTRPFVWTKTVEDILRSLSHDIAKISDAGQIVKISVRGRRSATRPSKQRLRREREARIVSSCATSPWVPGSVPPSTLRSVRPRRRNGVSRCVAASCLSIRPDWCSAFPQLDPYFHSFLAFTYRPRPEEQG